MKIVSDRGGGRKWIMERIERIYPFRPAIVRGPMGAAVACFRFDNLLLENLRKRVDVAILIQIPLLPVLIWDAALNYDPLRLPGQRPTPNAGSKWRA